MYHSLSICRSIYLNIRISSYGGTCVKTRSLSNERSSTPDVVIIKKRDPKVTEDCDRYLLRLLSLLTLSLSLFSPPFYTSFVATMLTYIYNVDVYMYKCAKGERKKVISVRICMLKRGENREGRRTATAGVNDSFLLALPHLFRQTGTPTTKPQEGCETLLLPRTPFDATISRWALPHLSTPSLRMVT